jgi:hypothetical protein
MALAAERLTHLLPSLQKCSNARTQAVDLIQILNAPANPAWLMARILALLNPYFEKQTPHAIREMEAEDWALELYGYPKWATEKAARWWKSKENTMRHKRPFEGDIAARAEIEMKFIRNATAGLDMPTPKRHADVDAKVWTPRNVAQKAEADRLTATVGGGLRVSK